jgi:hypothetical protein
LPLFFDYVACNCPFPQLQKRHYDHRKCQSASSNKSLRHSDNVVEFYAFSNNLNTNTTTAILQQQYIRIQVFFVVVVKVVVAIVVLVMNEAAAIINHLVQQTFSARYQQAATGSTDPREVAR